MVLVAGADDAVLASVTLPASLFVLAVATVCCGGLIAKLDDDADVATPAWAVVAGAAGFAEGEADALCCGCVAALATRTELVDEGGGNGTDWTARELAAAEVLAGVVDAFGWLVVPGGWSCADVTALEVASVGRCDVVAGFVGAGALAAGE